MSESTSSQENKQAIADRYWFENKKILLSLLSLWFIVALVCPVLLVDYLDQFSLGGFGLGFWFNQQGAILIFVAIIFIYHGLMQRLEARLAAVQAANDSQAES
jgi:putative solute:sodium symporter small subunit